MAGIADAGPLLLSLRLAVVTTAILLALGTPLAWWLSRTRRAVKPVVEALIALPIVLPPTVMGFYLLVLLGPEGAVGKTWLLLGGEGLTFRFSGLVIASVVYTLPFVVQPLQVAFEGVGHEVAEAAASLGASPADVFVSVTAPLARRGFLTASIMGIAHTLGEFGVVLMVGGSIPGETRVVSIAIYDHVETLDYAAAHATSATLLALAFGFMLLLYATGRQRKRA